MKQYALLAFLSPVASLLAVTGPAQSEKLKTKTNPQKQPNVIFIYADDLGYGDLECYGAKNVQTPHVNQLAESGVQRPHQRREVPGRQQVLLHVTPCSLENMRGVYREPVWQQVMLV